MKRLITLLLLWSAAALSQTTTYVANHEVFPNPERGFYHHTEVKSSNYQFLSESTLRGYRNEGITLILRVFYLDKYRTGSIPKGFFSNLNKDFGTIRKAGLKVIVRFAYSDKKDAGQRNATKAKIISHIKALAPYMKMNEDVIACFQAGFIGAWGEWYYTDHFGVENLTGANYNDRQQVLETMLSNFPAKNIAVRTPAIKQKMYGTAALKQSEAFTLMNKANVGHHNDCFLSASDDWGTYTNISSDYAYLEAENKYLPMGGETCNPSSYSECLNAIDKMGKFSYDYLNADYHQDVLDGFQAAGCMDEIKRNLGYRFELISSTITSSSVMIKLRNVGFGHLFNPRDVEIVYRNVDNGTEYHLKVNTECRLWLKGSTIVIAQERPQLVSGKYQLFLNLPDPKIARPEYSVRFANVGLWQADTGYNALNQTITIP